MAGDYRGSCLHKFGWHQWVNESLAPTAGSDLTSAVYAHIKHLDTTAEPQRAKVGDWIRVDYDHAYAPRGSVWKIDSVSNGIPYAFRDKDTSEMWGFSGDYTIVPDPTPEPEVFRGNPRNKKWGSGWFRNQEGTETILVGGDGSWARIGSDGIVWGIGDHRSGGCSYDPNTYHRISDNPAKGVKWDGGEG